MSRSIAIFIHILQVNRGYSLDFFKKSFKDVYFEAGPAVYPGSTLSLRSGALEGAGNKHLSLLMNHSIKTPVYFVKICETI